VRHVLDDDDRTHRADQPLRHLTMWLLVIVTTAVTVAIVVVDGPIWVFLAVSSSSPR
jgi:hypothetical protein